MSALIFTTKEVISDSLEDAVKNIPNIKRVDRQHYEDFNNYDYPSAFVNEVRDNRVYNLQDVIQVTSVYTVVLFDHSDAQEGEGGMGLSTKLNSLYALGLAAIMADPTRGGVAYNTRIASADTDAGFLAPHCVVVFTVEIDWLSQS